MWNADINMSTIVAMLLILNLPAIQQKIIIPITSLDWLPFSEVVHPLRLAIPLLHYTRLPT